MINNMRVQYLIIFITSFLLVSCKKQKDDEVQVLKDEVIAIHDEVMPLMSELKDSQQKILHKIEDLSENQSAEDSVVNELKKVERNLDEAYQSMFIWMRQFNSQFENMEEEEIKAYLYEQKEMVTKVNINIKTSLEEAKQYL
jgi:hypothetical protein